jgi:glycosyltransferase involved in cell wall biosynthesis
MKFLVVTFAPIIYKSNKPYAYAPYVKEMDLWMEHADEIMYACPEWETEGDLLIAPFKSNKTFIHTRLAPFDVTTLGRKLGFVFKLPKMVYTIYKAMRWADHIHLRCPGNVSLLGCFVQILFPKKIKTCKYAGNWDWKSKQPFSYRLQQRILRNTFFTKNMKVLVYGSWPDKNQNMLPFYTASYSQKEIIPTPPRTLDGEMRMMFVGAFMPSKEPIISIKVCEQLIKTGHNVHLDMYGDGSEKAACEAYVAANNLQDRIVLHGNKPASEVKLVFQKAHFLVFISRSEGWPKVVAESLFWGCVPITTAVSCVPEMVGNGSRGKLVTNNATEIIATIQYYLDRPHEYAAASEDGMRWSRQFTLEKFENDIKKVLDGTHPGVANSR